MTALLLLLHGGLDGPPVVVLPLVSDAGVASFFFLQQAGVDGANTSLPR